MIYKTLLFKSILAITAVAGLGLGVARFSYKSPIRDSVVIADYRQEKVQRCLDTVTEFFNKIMADTEARMLYGSMLCDKYKAFVDEDGVRICRITPAMIQEDLNERMVACMEGKES